MSNGISESKKYNDFIDPQMEDDYKNCTFRPKINEKYNLKIQKTETFSRLYYESIRRQHSSNAKVLFKDNLESKLMTSPLINSNSPNRGNTSSERNFLNRIDDYHRINNNKISKLTKENEEKLLDECTFSPKIISKINLTSNKPVSTRLYEDNLRRLKTSQSREKERIELLKSSSRERSLNMNKIEILYKDHEEHWRKIEKLKISHDKEQGITFKPDIKIPDNIEIKGNFAERNIKLLESKRKYSDMDVKKTSQLNLSSKESLKMEKEIINRLYHNDMEKVLIRAALQDQEIKYDYKNDLRNKIHKLDKQINRTPKKNYSNNSKSNAISSDNNHTSDRHGKNKSNITFKKPPSVRSIGNNHKYNFDEEIDYNNINSDTKTNNESINFEKPYFSKNSYSLKSNNLAINEQSEFREQDYADSLRQNDENYILDNKEENVKKDSNRYKDK